MKNLDNKSELKTNLKFNNSSELHTASFLAHMIQVDSWLSTWVRDSADDYIRILMNAKEKTDNSLTCRQHKKTVEALKYGFLNLQHRVKTYCNKDVIEIYYNLWK
tara:strand:- start:286 stop:600 length:315 start_codon:yes stop_codon:yes gene_type:complete